MSESIHAALIAIALILVCVGGYYRIQSQRTGEPLDRTREGWPILIGIRLVGLLTLGSTIAWIWKPAMFEWASLPVPTGVRWIGVAGFACAVAWLIWMFHSLGRNLTDTVVTRRNANFVDHGPYRLIRNPMYTGVLVTGMSVGLALGTWIVPFATAIIFTLFALRTRIEERYLIERFGDQYLEYMKHVSRFFPKLPS